MTIGWPKYLTNNCRITIVSSIAILIVLLTVFTWDSLILILSRPNHAAISSSFSGAIDVHRYKSSQVAVEVEVEVGVQSSNDETEIDQNQNSNTINSSDDSECDFYQGEWFYDPVGPLYTNNTCPSMSQQQNCQGNRRPDKEYENWRWKPYNCELPRFNATKFLELMSGKTITFVGDSLSRNQMQSLMCMLLLVETPLNTRNRRWLFKDKNVTMLRFWSPWLVNHTTEPFSNITENITKMFLDVPDTIFMEEASKSDVVVFTNGHWFPKPAIYFINNENVGGQLWTPPDNKTLNITSTEAFELSTETTLTALATHPNYSGLTIVTTYSPVHYESGTWNTGGSCTGKVRPILPGKIVEHKYTNDMHDKQVSAFYKATKKKTNKSKMKLMDITEAFKYRHDGHPGPYRSPDPNQITQRDPNGRPPPQDCSHWCLPGPIDVWNEIMLEIIRREFEYK